MNYWLTPVAKLIEDLSPEESVGILLEEIGIYAFADSTRAVRHLRLGDRICFYCAGQGGQRIVAQARIASPPRNEQHPRILLGYDWVIDLDETSLLDTPTEVDAELRSRLEAFEGKSSNTLNKHWSWFVRETHTLNRHDFRLLTQTAL